MKGLLQELTRSQASVAGGALIDVLAQHIRLYQLAYLAHWNVRGKSFRSTHKLFEEIYEELEDAIDRIAERARTMNVVVPSYVFSHQFINLDGTQSPQRLHSMWAEQAEAAITTLSERRQAFSDDPASDGLIADRLEALEKHIWMVRNGEGPRRSA